MSYVPLYRKIFSRTDLPRDILKYLQAKDLVFIHLTLHSCVEHGGIRSCRFTTRCFTSQLPLTNLPVNW